MSDYGKLKIKPFRNDIQTTENLHKVPKKTWKKWSDEAKLVFNRIYDELCYPSNVTHPKMADPEDVHWDVLRYNVAWLAAYHVNNL